MDASRRTDDEQAARWNGPAGNAWVDLQELLDEMFRPFEELLVEAVAAEHAGSVLDVGCGTGGVTRAVARRAGHCVGVDISGPMIETARAHAEREGVPASFIQADARSIQGPSTPSSRASVSCSSATRCGPSAICGAR
ncbi:class I SAM-dependent methyltransferase [Streptomyces violaceochromogenes]|uniref:Class I SAM-dependent methyltransferase n=1 Tax=Streptomyces violaceochromogenes TaxID=67377 RepID=A0ABU6LS17_9ACTN|nr:class I SAM-dependent methyltransferase [Streptomyces violaceochromogenes]MEC7052203.1 class I SAM-dependent methyltransferase [Streptomyces violaceochromogenes]GHC81327.1 hypothetical protein GCM10010309_57130 [Streptomyces violaceochromogenes]